MLYTISLGFLAGLLPFSFASQNIYQRQSGLDNKDINLVHSWEVLDVRSVLRCVYYCNYHDLCFMISYKSETKHCQGYSIPISVIIQDIGDKDGTVYYRNNEKACNAGMYYDGEVCVSCSEGYYQNSTGQTECIPCPKGQYQDLQGQPSCTPCSPGLYQDQTAGTSCMPCLNTTQSRYEVTNEGTRCRKCYQFLNTYSYGDMGNIMKYVDYSSGDQRICMNECDAIDCKMLTDKRHLDQCVLHSTDSYQWGYTSTEGVYHRYC